jgi:hypothetical protein
MPAPMPCSNGCIPCGRDKSRRDKSFPPPVCRTPAPWRLRARPSSGAAPMAAARFERHSTYTTFIYRGISFPLVSLWPWRHVADAVAQAFYISIALCISIEGDVSWASRNLPRRYPA